jgi:Holliday junction resolvase RusA-like endonuclease
MITIRGELHSSKNSRQIWRDSTGKTRVVKSDKSKADEGVFLEQLTEQRQKWESMLAANPLKNATLHICFSIRRKTKRRFDYVNIVQGLCDAMVKAGYLVDDDAEHFLPSFDEYEIDPKNPGCDFWIE